jgi:hypothetical protein
VEFLDSADLAARKVVDPYTARLMEASSGFQRKASA